MFIYIYVHIYIKGTFFLHEHNPTRLTKGGKTYKKS